MTDKLLGPDQAAFLRDSRALAPALQSLPEESGMLDDASFKREKEINGLLRRLYKLGACAIAWRYQDVQQLRPLMSDEQALQALDRIRRSLEDHSVEAGWGIMERLLFQEEIV